MKKKLITLITAFACLGGSAEIVSPVATLGNDVPINLDTLGTLSAVIPPMAPLIVQLDVTGYCTPQKMQEYKTTDWENLYAGFILHLTEKGEKITSLASAAFQAGIPLQITVITDFDTVGVSFIFSPNALDVMLNGDLTAKETYIKNLK
jgi:hypothetical protein